MRHVKITQFNHRPSIKEAVALMRQERQGYSAAGENIMQAFEQAEAELLAQQQPQVRVVAPAPIEKVTPLRGLADDVACVDDEEEAVVESTEEGDETDLDEDERTELVVEAALGEEETGATAPDEGYE